MSPFAPPALAALVLVLAATPAAAGDPVGLGTAKAFAVLAGSGITNTGATTITGDVGTFPTTAQTGFSSVTLVGTNHRGDAVTQGAKDDLVTAYDDAAGRTPATPHVVELGGKTLLAGVYTNEAFGLTGTLTLDAQGVADAQFVFQMGSTLITEVDSRVLLINGASPCRVVWQVGSSATFKTGTRFAGDVLAYTSVSAQTGATFAGRLLARNGAVTLQRNTITNAACHTPAATASPTPTPSAAPTASVPRSPAPVRPAALTPAAAVPGQTGGGPRTGAPPSLPDTGGTPLAVTGLGLLATGSLLVAAARPRGRHRRARFARLA
ncbi:MAG TPA: ice-binding family protein [Frankiaceae bacterium]|nr:ice-binding family protein [Frankiaceae bacterium]